MRHKADEVYQEAAVKLNKMDFVGLMEEMTKSVAMLSCVLGIPEVQVPKKNVGSYQQVAAPSSPRHPLPPTQEPHPSSATTHRPPFAASLHAAVESCRLRLVILASLAPAVYNADAHRLAPHTTSPPPPLSG